MIRQWCENDQKMIPASLVSIPWMTFHQISTSDRYDDPISGLFGLGCSGRLPSPLRVSSPIPTLSYPDTVMLSLYSISQTLTVARPLSVAFFTIFLPPNLTMFAIRAWVQQAVRLSVPPNRKAAVPEEGTLEHRTQVVPAFPAVLKVVRPKRALEVAEVLLHLPFLPHHLFTVFNAPGYFSMSQSQILKNEVAKSSPSSLPFLRYLSCQPFWNRTLDTSSLEFLLPL
jgi:hypothetical protein